MLELGCPKLSQDPAAIRVVKEEVVTVVFADTPGLVMSAVGPNHYAAGDALVTGSTGDPWCVSRERFDAKYRHDAGQAHGEPGPYRNVPTPVWAKQIPGPFRIARSPGGDVLTGEAGDWALEYAPDDCGLVARDRFERVYRPA